MKQQKRIGTVVAVAWERDCDDNRHPLVVVLVCRRAVKFYDHPSEGWQVIAIGVGATQARHSTPAYVEGAEACERELPRVLGAPLDWGRTGAALARIAEDLYEHGWARAGELWQGKRVNLHLRDDGAEDW